MTLLFRVLALPLPLWAPLALLVLVGSAVGVRSCQLGSAESDLAAARVQIGQLQEQAGARTTQIEQLRAGVLEQNAAVDLWHLEAEKAQERAQLAEGRAQQVRVETRERVVEVLRAPVPSDCDGAVRWGAQEAQRIGAAWGATR